MLASRTLRRPPRRTALIVATVAVVVLAMPLAWYLASPLFLTQAVSESAPAAPAQSRLAAGTFGVVDGIHRGEGTASLVQLPDGQRVLRLEEDFRVTNGPTCTSICQAPRLLGQVANFTEAVRSRKPSSRATWAARIMRCPATWI